MELASCRCHEETNEQQSELNLLVPPPISELGSLIILQFRVASLLRSSQDIEWHSQTFSALHPCQPKPVSHQAGRPLHKAGLLLFRTHIRPILRTFPSSEKMPLLEQLEEKTLNIAREKRTKHIITEKGQTQMIILRRN